MTTTKFNMEMLDKSVEQLGTTSKDYEAIIAGAKDAIKAFEGKAKLTVDEQQDRDDILDFIREATAYSKELTSKEKASSSYTVKPGTEKCVHLRLQYGKRFDSSTGKEISPSYIQVFTYSEWQLFKAHHISLGYRIAEVLHDPYGEAKKD